LPEHCPEVS
jgi:hypothetical protein